MNVRAGNRNDRSYWGSLLITLNGNEYAITAAFSMTVAAFNHGIELCKKSCCECGRNLPPGTKIITIQAGGARRFCLSCGRVALQNITAVNDFLFDGALAIQKRAAHIVNSI